MRTQFSTLAILCAALAFFTGCSRKTDATGDLDKAAKALAQADVAPPTATQVAPPAAAAASGQQSPSQQMNQAMTLYKSGDYQNAMAHLQTLRQRSTLSPQQNMALQDAMAAVMTDVYTRASKGDARAQQAVKEYEQSKNVRTK
jgi:hypothetical protein